MDILKELAHIVIEAKSTVADLVEFTKLPIFSGPLPLTETCVPHHSVQDALTNLQNLNYQCQKKVDGWETKIQTIPGLDFMGAVFTEARKAIEEVRKSGQSYFKIRSEFLFKISRDPVHYTEYQHALTAFDKDFTQEMEGGAKNFIRSLRMIAAIVLKIIEALTNPSPSEGPDSKPPPPGMYV